MMKSLGTCSGMKMLTFNQGKVCVDRKSECGSVTVYVGETVCVCVEKEVEGSVHMCGKEV